MPSPNLSELVTTTLRERAPDVADNVSDSNALLRRLKKKGNIWMVDGGRNITMPLEYAEGTFTRYAGYEQIDITPADVLSAAEYEWKQAAVSISMSGLEKIQNAGKNQVINWLTARVSNAEKTMANNISADIYSDGTGSSGKQIGGLALLVSNTPTSGTVGAINAANFSFWQNVEYSDVSDFGATATSTNMQSYMNRAWVQVVRGQDQPDLVVADNNYYLNYLGSLSANQRFTGDPSLAEAGFHSIKFMKADVLLDGGQGGDMATNRMYMLNTDYLKFVTHTDRNFVTLDDDRFSTNQDAFVRLMGWAGNLVCSNRSLQAVLRNA